MYVIDTKTYKCFEGSHVFKILDLKNVNGEVEREIPDNKYCECGKYQYGDYQK